MAARGHHPGFGQDRTPCGLGALERCDQSVYYAIFRKPRLFTMCRRFIDHSPQAQRPMVAGASAKTPNICPTPVQILGKLSLGTLGLGTLGLSVLA